MSPQAMLRTGGLALEQALIDNGYDKFRAEPILYEGSNLIRYIETRLTVGKYLVLIETRHEDDDIIHKMFAREITASMHRAVINHANPLSLIAKLEGYKHDQAGLHAPRYSAA